MKKFLLFLCLLPSFAFGQWTGRMPSPPASPSSVPQTCIYTPSGASNCVWNLSGVPTNAQTGTTYTVLSTDRANYVSFSNASAIAVTLPQSGSTGFASNFVFVTCDIGAGTTTITPTTSTISFSTGAAYTSGSATMTLTTGQCAWIYSDNTNYFAIRFSASSLSTPISIANGGTGTGSTLTGLVRGNASAMTAAELSGDATTSGSNAVTIASGAVTGAKMANNTVTATQLAAQYSKGACTELWGGSGTSFALTSGDDAISNNSCYNDSAVTRTITAVKCRSDNASNTTTVNPTFGAAGTGTTILSGALTCGNSLAYSSTGTVSNASWTTGTGINPIMGGTLTGTSIAVIVEYTY